MHRFDQYIDDVISGRRVSGIKERQMVERHLRDMERDGDDLVFDRAEAQRVVSLHDNLKLYEAVKKGTYMILEPFQVFIVASVWGWWWKNEEKGRRFSYIYEEVGRKNAKSTRMAGTAIIATEFDYEPSPENYCIATNHTQAYKSFLKAHKIAQKTGLIDNKRFWKPTSHKPLALVPLLLESGEYIADGFYEPLANVPDAHEGLNPYLVIVEEYHVHKTSDFYDVMDQAIGTRKNRMIWIITTAGVNMDGPCYIEHQIATDVLSGKIENDNLFAVIYAIDPEDATGDNWKNEECWPKANPGLGSLKSIEDMRILFSKAVHNPSKRAEFRRKQLGVWGEEEDAWLDEDVIQANIGEVLTSDQREELMGEMCVAAIDAGNTKDLTSLDFEFANPFDDGKDVFDSYYFAPEGAAKSDKGNAPNYLKWKEEGWLEVTEGQMSDNSAIIRRILYARDVLGYNIHQIHYDPTFLKDTAKYLEEEEGFVMIVFKQNRVSYTGPINAMEAKMLKADPSDCDKIIGGYNMGGNPMTQWMLRNIRIRNYGQHKMPEKPNHEHSPRKIDGVVTKFMAEGLMASLPEEAPKPMMPFRLGQNR